MSVRWYRPDGPQPPAKCWHPSRMLKSFTHHPIYPVHPVILSPFVVFVPLGKKYRDGRELYAYADKSFPLSALICTICG